MKRNENTFWTFYIYIDADWNTEHLLYSTVLHILSHLLFGCVWGWMEYHRNAVMYTKSYYHKDCDSDLLVLLFCSIIIIIISSLAQWLALSASRLVHLHACTHVHNRTVHRRIAGWYFPQHLMRPTEISLYVNWFGFKEKQNKNEILKEIATAEQRNISA